MLAIDGLQPEKGHATLYVVRELECTRVWFAEPLLSSATPEVQQLPVFSAKYPPEHAPGKGLQSLVGAPLPGDVRGRSGH